MNIIKDLMWEQNGLDPTCWGLFQMLTPIAVISVSKLKFQDK